MPYLLTARMLSFDSQVAHFGATFRAFIGYCWLLLAGAGTLRGGIAVYRNSPAAARRYLEAGRARADDYYLTEGTGLAEHFNASPTLGVTHLGALSGDAYEAWVAGLDAQTGEPKGRLRSSENAVRFVEVTINGPKSWSLAAAIDPGISAAYDAAQDSAAKQILGWLANHATTRIGPAGAQVQVPVQEIEAVTVRHYTSRAGDPHRHLHLQINARVRAEQRWYGLHTVGVRDSLDAINGIGHAAMMTDPGFREALAARGYSLDPSTGELLQMREYVGAFSARTRQIEANLDRYEADWRNANPGAEPGPQLRQTWDRRAWNDARPGKIVPGSGADITAAWVAELRALGYRDPAGPVNCAGIRPGQLDRSGAVGAVSARLAKRRSAWNAADVRGEVEQLIARAGVVTDESARTELAEDLAARTLADCVPLLDRPGLPDHLRMLTSRHVLDVEADLTTRLSDRGQRPPTAVSASADPAPDNVPDELDMGQRRVAAVLAGDARLVVVEGAAGAGKTTTLAAARAAIEAQGHRLLVVTPTRKAAQVAGHQLGTPAHSAAWLAVQHGWRSNADGTWVRLSAGQIDPANGREYEGTRPEACINPGDVVLVDEAGMLDQDTARALLHIADEHGARLVLVGDRHQLAAVGRGGVLDLAVRLAHPDACVELSTVHRFTDPDFANLSLAMREGKDPAAVFDALVEKGLIELHDSEIERTDALADRLASMLIAGRQVRVLADTKDQAAVLNSAVRERLVAAGRVNDRRVVPTRAGQRLGVGDVVMTRRNDRNLGVANRDSWTITSLAVTGAITVEGANGARALPAHYVRQHVQLAYASTVHAAQGETVDAAHLVLGEHTGAASAYVGMTRGRDTNTVHVVAESVADAREQWVETFSRNRADLGPTAAADRAAVEASRYAPQRPLEDALADLRQAWTVEADLRGDLEHVVAQRAQCRKFLAARARQKAARERIDSLLERAQDTVRATREEADRSQRLIDTQTARYVDTLQHGWARDRPSARTAAATVLAGPGRFGLHHRRVTRAQAYLQHWADTWRPVMPDLPTDPRQLASLAAASHDTPAVHRGIQDHAHTVVKQANPDHDAIVRAAQAAQEHAHQLQSSRWRTFWDLDRPPTGPATALAADPDAALAGLDHRAANLTERHHQAREHVAELLREPAIRSQPPDRIEAEHDAWRHGRQAKQKAARREQLARRAQFATADAGYAHRHDPASDYAAPSPSEHHRGISL